MAYDTRKSSLYKHTSFKVQKQGSDKFELNKLEMIALNANIKHSLIALQDSIIRLGLSKNDDVG
ncbi:hypothetical protein [Campylobacter pinnipediorum]|uniref:hypothetical protein n=1 Tax=Campylobacter pinnipediorum TaxID=1965231 RepID=UPI00084D6E2F|nr:hypothetical protein [Campylobacter pinnipediorum]